jgi:hypothetical protein
MGISYKKTLRHPKADADARLLFQAKIKLYEAQGRPIVYIDESGFAHDMPRTHGYSLIGQRCYGNARLAHQGAHQCHWSLAWQAFAHCQPVCSQYRRRYLLRLDSAGFNPEAGHTLEYLPPYSPDINPVEPKWAQAKVVRKQKHCSVKALFREYAI